MLLFPFSKFIEVEIYSYCCIFKKNGRKGVCLDV